MSLLFGNGLSTVNLASQVLMSSVMVMPASVAALPASSAPEVNSDVLESAITSRTVDDSNVNFEEIEEINKRSPQSSSFGSS